MKAYTDLNQSKKLSEILPLESADMFWYRDAVTTEVNPRIMNCMQIPELQSMYYSPCWSLAALLGVLRTFTTPTAFSVKVSTPSLIKTENGYKLTYTGDYTPMINNELDVEAPIESMAENAVDAYYEMIIKLHELKML